MYRRRKINRKKSFRKRGSLKRRQKGANRKINSYRLARGGIRM